MCALVVGLPDVIVLGIDDLVDGPLRVHVETTAARPVCDLCGSAVWVKDRRPLELAALLATITPR